MKRRAFLYSTLATVASSPLWAQQNDDRRQRPNILFVMADQLRSMELGCYGGDQVPTPNMDRLGREGVRFTHAYSTYPVCSPYRAMLMTGNFPMKNGMLLNDHYLRNPGPYFAEVCGKHGYRTGYIGKWHIDGHGRTAYIPPERRLGFDYWRTLECTHQYFDSKYYHQDERKTRTWEGYDSIDQTRSACEFIRDESNPSPFCLFLSWGPPHDPYVAPPEYMQQFDPETIRLRDNVDDFDTCRKLWSECDTRLPDSMASIRKNFIKNLRDTSNQAIRRWYQGYYAATATLDDCLGTLIETLEETGQLDNTILVFTSDHGDNLGSHRQYGKQLPFEESVSVPFMIRYPSKIPAGIETDCLLSPVDIMPTLLGLADIDSPEVDGMNLSQAAMGRNDNQQEAVLLMRMVWLGTNWITNGTGPWRGVRTKRWTYARKSDTGEPWFLFDNEADPQQMQNLVQNPQYASTLQGLDATTTRLLEKAGDPEDPVAIARTIERERTEKGMPIQKEILYPEKIKPGADFQKLLS